MGLNYLSHELFNPRWVASLRGAPESAMVAEVQVFVPGTAEAMYDPELDLWDRTDVALYQGKARVQPLRAAASRVEPGNETQVQNVLVSIPVDEDVDIRPGQRMRVITSPLNLWLTKYQYVVSEIMDSSNPIERTFMCTVDQETVVEP
jgi:hypothetical protein